MSPVMARCPHLWPIRECLECAPPALFVHTSPDDPDGLCLDEAPPIAVTIAVTGLGVTAVIVLSGVTAAAWAVGAVLDTLRRRP